MKKKTLLELAKEIQIEIQKDELTEFLNFFNSSLKTEIEFLKKIKFSNNIKEMDRINIVTINLSSLKKLSKNFLEEKLVKNLITKNSLVDEKGYIILKKKFLNP